MTTGKALLEITREPDSFRLSGEIDLSNVDQLMTAISPEVREGNTIVLDCSELEFVDSTGMAALIKICRNLGESGRLTLQMVPASVAKAAHILGLERVTNLEIVGARPGSDIAATA